MGTVKFWIQRINLWMCYAGMGLIIPRRCSPPPCGRPGRFSGVPGSVELSSYILNVFILLGVGYTQQVKGHVQVSMLTMRLPAGAQRGLEAFTSLLSLGVIGLLAWQGWVVGMEETAVSDMLRIPQRPFKLPGGRGGLFSLPRARDRPAHLTLLLTAKRSS